MASQFIKLDDFINYFKASLQYEVIRKKSKAKGATGRAWRKAYDYLHLAILHGQRLDLDIIEQAVKLAEHHLRDADATTPSEDLAARAAAAQPEKKGKTFREKRMEKKLKTLEAKLAGKGDDTKSASAAGNPAQGAKSSAPHTPYKGAQGKGDHPAKGDPPAVCKVCGDKHY